MTYYIYHIPGKKIGVTRDLEKRVTKQQGYEPHEYEILHTYNEDEIEEVSLMETYLQKKYGSVLMKYLIINLNLIKKKTI